MLLLDGAQAPRSGHPQRFTGQHWAAAHENASNHGLIANVTLDDWRIRGGIFRSYDHIPINYQPTISYAGDPTDAARAVIAEKDNDAAALSGQIQAARIFREGPRQHQLLIAAWGRDQHRAYGSVDTAEIAPGPIDRSSFVPEPEFVFGPRTRDHVRQLTLGLSYEGSWQGVGELDLGIEKAHYTKVVVTPAGSLPTSSDAPWLLSASGSLSLSSRLTAYAGISRGLEESDVAPSVAVNRSEAPPAIRTRQADAGIKLSLAPTTTIVAGVFKIEKPYYGLDATRYFRRLGTIRNRGAEISLTARPAPGLTVVGGALLLDGAITGSEVAAGSIGRRPPGWTPTNVLLNADYRFPRAEAWSLDVGLQQTGRSVVSADNGLRLPSRTLIDLGVRYRFLLLGKASVLRIQVANVTNRFSWDVVGAGALMVHPSRQILARLATDI